ncbi:MAG: hypothetical protein ABIY70_08915 [Capsulimonas sp.]|uniref:hypothetical protein n=1 Tax=Capsulimonas sp. TaxID=2494211 RepID=UPI00326519FA
MSQRTRSNKLDVAGDALFQAIANIQATYDLTDGEWADLLTDRAEQFRLLTENHEHTWVYLYKEPSKHRPSSEYGIWKSVHSRHFRCEVCGVLGISPVPGARIQVNALAAPVQEAEERKAAAWNMEVNPSIVRMER